MPGPSTERTCLRDGCAATLRVADAVAIEFGAPLWSCDAGHSGPRIQGARSYSE